MLICFLLVDHVVQVFFACLISQGSSSLIGLLVRLQCPIIAAAGVGLLLGFFCGPDHELLPVLFDWSKIVIVYNFLYCQVGPLFLRGGGMIIWRTQVDVTGWQILIYLFHQSSPSQIRPKVDHCIFLWVLRSVAIFSSLFRYLFVCTED